MRATVRLAGRAADDLDRRAGHARRAAPAPAPAPPATVTPGRRVPGRRVSQTLLGMTRATSCRHGAQSKRLRAIDVTVSARFWRSVENAAYAASSSACASAGGGLLLDVGQLGAASLTRLAGQRRRPRPSGRARPSPPSSDVRGAAGAAAGGAGAGALRRG